MARKAKKSTRLLRAEAHSDFTLGRDEVVRRGDGVFIVDREGLYRDRPVAPDEITEFPAYVERTKAETSVSRLISWARVTRVYPYLSDAGKAERLAVIKARIVALTGRCTFVVEDLTV